MFRDKDILDIGCNIGHVTYSVARDFFAKSVLGIDIDNTLIQIARKNIRYYNNSSSPAVEKLLQTFDIDEDEPVVSDYSSRFPDNVSFLHVSKRFTFNGLNFESISFLSIFAGQLCFIQ